MYLLIDIGNTRIKWATVQQHQFQYGGYSFYKSQPYHATFDKLWHKLTKPERVVVSNVSGELAQQALQTWAQARWQLQPEFVVAQATYAGLQLGYQQAASYGVDRWLAMLAAWQEFQAPICLIGAGSATTVDVVNGQGHHLGSYIAPGLYLQRNAMATLSHCALPEDYAWPSAPLHYGDSTYAAIAEGIIAMTTGFLRHQLSLCQQRFGEDLVCLINGGDSELLLTYLPQPILHRPYLVLEGLAAYV